MNPGQEVSAEGAGALSQLRKIIHVDMDAFYASVEQRDNPELRGKPVAEGGARERGVVAAASYEARRFGIHSAMASVTAKRRCPELLFVKPRFDVYKEVSLQIRGIFASYTHLIEPLSLDEAYLDVTENLHGIGPATAAKMDRLGIHTGADLKAQTRAFLEERFGKSGGYYYWIARGIDDRPVRPDRVRKSIGAENTFAQDVWSLTEASAELQPIIDKVWTHCEQTQVRGRTVTLKVKFQQITRSR